jgi:hypothetical protein
VIDDLMLVDLGAFHGVLLGEKIQFIITRLAVSVKQKLTETVKNAKKRFEIDT